MPRTLAALALLLVACGGAVADGESFEYSGDDESPAAAPDVAAPSPMDGDDAVEPTPAPSPATRDDAPPADEVDAPPFNVAPSARIERPSPSAPSDAPSSPGDGDDAVEPEPTPAPAQGWIQAGDPCTADEQCAAPYTCEMTWQVVEDGLLATDEFVCAFDATP